MRLLKLTEANLNRVSDGHEKDGYIILSAFRSDLTHDENNARTNELRDWLRDHHYSYIGVYGKYREKISNEFKLEKSFIVYPFDIVSKSTASWEIFEKDLSDIAKKYDQDSILICRPKEKPFYKGLKPGIRDEKCFSGTKLNDVTQDYFTALKKWSDISLNRKNHDWSQGSPQRFTFESFEDADEVPELFLNMPPNWSGSAHANYSSRNMNIAFIGPTTYKELLENGLIVDMEDSMW